MKSLLSAALAFGLTAAVSTAAFACPYSNTTAEGKNMTPIVTADSVVVTDDKG